jgi:PAS domain S-box-containing protein
MTALDSRCAAEGVGMQIPVRRTVLSYGIATAGVVLAGLSHWWLAPILGDTPPVRLLLVIVVMVSAWLGGLGPGLFATALGLLAIVAANDAPGDLASLITRMVRFGSLGLLITWLFAVIHTFRYRAQVREQDLRRSELALREKESVLRSFYESSVMALGVIELTEDDARFISTNALTDKFFGLAPGKLEGRSAKELSAPVEMMSLWLEKFRECRSTLQPVRFEYEAHCPSSPDWVAATLSPMCALGSDRVLCSFIVEDVTERKRVEAELRDAKEAAEEACRAKDRFLAVLSHELRTPLTPVLFGVSSILDSNPGPELIPTLEMIRRNIELEARLIDDLLDLSRFSRGRMRLEFEIIDIHETIRRAIEICNDETFVAGLEVVTELSAAQHHVNADDARLMQIFWNLIRNAVKFTPPNGKLTIRSTNGPGPDGGVEGETQLIAVEFEDTGIGIERSVLPRIFEAFEQYHDDLRGRAGGLGLGLAISRSLAEAFGGRLVASSPGRGRGSTFRLELATVPAEVDSAAGGSLPGSPASPSDAIARSDLRILLVDDNTDTLRYLATVLRQRGHEVVTADCVAAARAAVNEAKVPFDLLLSDIELPDGDGMYLMRELRARGQIPGIAVSGFGAEEDRRLSREAGFFEHLTKPVDLNRLEAAIHRATSRAVNTDEPSGPFSTGLEMNGSRC